MLQTLIIDDEAHIRDTLSKMLLKYCPQVRVSGEAYGVASGIKAIAELQPDLVFLDINLNDGNAFDLLHALKSLDFSVVFISSFSREYISAFRLSGLEYLQKPFNPEDLKKVVQHTEEPHQRDLPLQLQALEENLSCSKKHGGFNGR
jgi:two-component system LytT family response regulator